MTTLSILASISGTFMGASGIPQLIKILQRKSSSDLSRFTYAIISTGALIWLLYGLELNDYPLIISNTIGLLVNLSILILTFRY